MTTIEKTVAEHVVDFLVRREVSHVFGLCGHTNIAVLAAMADSPIDFVTVRHEQIASHAADAYARVDGATNRAIAQSDVTGVSGLNETHAVAREVYSTGDFITDGVEALTTGSVDGTNNADVEQRNESAFRKSSQQIHDELLRRSRCAAHSR